MRSLYFRKSIILLVSKVCPPMLEGKFFCLFSPMLEGKFFCLFSRLLSPNILCQWEQVRGCFETNRLFKKIFAFFLKNRLRFDLSIPNK